MHAASLPKHSKIDAGHQDVNITVLQQPTVPPLVLPQHLFARCALAHAEIPTVPESIPHLLLC
jgi:hypothetical protein